MSSVSLDHETHEAATRIALDVFTDCVNRGLPMQDALLAIYMTGMENGISARNAQED